jgi:hypothetical protein
MKFLKDDKNVISRSARPVFRNKIAIDLARNLFLCMLFLLAATCLAGSGNTWQFLLPGEVKPVYYAGNGPAQVSLRWNGPSIVSFSAGAGTQPFIAELQNGAESLRMEKTSGNVNEYRGFEFDSNLRAILSVEGDRKWTVALFPVSTRYFANLHVPGKYQGNGNAVILIDGKYSVATFELDCARNFSAWAYGPGRIGDILYITPDGDYKGKSVLPLGAKWIVVSATGTWSLEMQVPCCEVPAGY